MVLKSQRDHNLMILNIQTDVIFLLFNFSNYKNKHTL